jgi:CBS domain-containing protein
LGFGKVLCYKPGKADWLACGLPVEKDQPGALPLVESMTREFPTCRLNDSLDDARQAAERLGWDMCPVVNEVGIVLGLLQEDAWKQHRDGSVEQIMDPAPLTFRANYPLDDATEFLNKQALDAALVTTSDGTLMGIFKRRKTAEQNQIPKSEIRA